MDKDAYWFRHDSNAFHDQKILKLRASFGLEGYGFYWAIIEMLRNEKDYHLSSDDLETLAFSMNSEETKIKQMLSKCLTIGLLSENEGKVFSSSLLHRMKKHDEVKAKRSMAGKKGGRPKQTESKCLTNAKQKKAIREEESREEDIRKDKKYTIDSKPYDLLSASEQKERDSFLNASRYLHNAITEQGKATRVMRPESATWLKEFRLLKGESSDSWEDISNTLKGYCANIGAQYMPEAYSASSFREKYDRIKARLNNSNEKEVETEWKL